MQPASPQPASGLVLGDVRFLTGALPAPSTDTITLVPVSLAPTMEPRNTIVLVWRELGPTHLMARTMDGQHRAVTPCDAGDLFDAAFPGHQLHRGNSLLTPAERHGYHYNNRNRRSSAVERETEPDG